VDATRLHRGLRCRAGPRKELRIRTDDRPAEPYLAGPAADIRTGQALQRVLLTATVLGLSVSFLSQIVEIATAREELRRLISGTRPPLAVLRIGRGPGAGHPRRDVAGLVIPDPAEIRS
jgi:hypothetical protein